MASGISSAVWPVRRRWSGAGLGDILGGALQPRWRRGRRGVGWDGRPARVAPADARRAARRAGGSRRSWRAFRRTASTAQANSWVGTGENEPISGADVRKVVGEEDLANIATALGVSEDEAANAVARVLPEVVDRVSPDGQPGARRRARLDVRGTRRPRGRYRGVRLKPAGHGPRGRRRGPSGRCLARCRSSRGTVPQREAAATGTRHGRP